MVPHLEGAFLLGVLKAAQSWCAIWRKAAEELGIPYLEREQEPLECLDVPKALDRLGDRKVEGVYFHVPTLNLVLVVGEDRIGIRSNVLSVGKEELLRALRRRYDSL